MSKDSGDPLVVREATVGQATVLTMSGLLDGSTYLDVRDRVVEAALDDLNRVIVDVTDSSVNIWSTGHVATWSRPPASWSRHWSTTYAGIPTARSRYGWKAPVRK